MLGLRNRNAIRLAVLLAVIASAALTFAVPEADGAMDRVPSERRIVALTFDDGPDARYTPAVLDALRDAGATATFFVVGENAIAHPEIVSRMLEEGHEVAVHTQTHPRLESLPAAGFADEVDECIVTLRSLGVEPRWYRPPRGYRDANQEYFAVARGLEVVLWSQCFESHHHKTAESMAHRVARATRPGDIVLAHDGLGDRTMTVDAVPIYLEEMARRGFEVVSLGDLE